MKPLADPITLTAQLGAPYGVERSIKFLPGRVLDQRYLVSIHRNALGDAPIARLTAMGQALALPQVGLDGLLAAFEGADIVHFGRERDGAGEILKIYFEYASAVRDAMNAATRAPTLAHRAFKWKADSGGPMDVALYKWLPCRTYGEIAAHLDDPALADAATPATLCARSLLARLERTTGAGELLLMSVEEAGNSRHSLDLNLYRAGLRVGAVADLIEAAALALASPAPATRTALARSADRSLGHVSIGVARCGEPFLTIYFGVEAH